MTDNEIVRALEDIAEKYGCFDKDQAPLVYMRSENAKAILDLINRQKTEIDILIRKKDTLREENAEQHQAIINALHRMGQIRAEAIKEFAERLKENFEIYTDDEESNALYVRSLIDNLVKEMTEVKENA